MFDSDAHELPESAAKFIYVATLWKPRLVFVWMKKVLPNTTSVAMIGYNYRDCLFAALVPGHCH